jgi:hypothetical protein
MNDIEDLRNAMHATPDFEPGPLDLTAVMVAGGRLRRRRRLAVGAASGLAVVALLVGGAQFTRGEPERAPGIGAAASRDSGVLGEVVPTGLWSGKDEWVLYIVPLQDIPGVPFGVVAGRRLASGSLTADVLTNERTGSARAAGFHAGQKSMVVGNVTSPTFGYYAGGASRITVRADGKLVEAHQAIWSEDPSIVLFWFDPLQVEGETRLTQLTAYDSNGRTLPAGDNKFGVG